MGTIDETTKDDGAGTQIPAPELGHGTAEVGKIYHGNTISEFDDIIGVDTPVRHILVPLFERVDSLVYFTRVTQANAAPTAAAARNARLAALNLSEQAGHTPTVLAATKNISAPGDVATANTFAAAVEAKAEKLKCRAVLNTAQDEISKALAWGMIGNTGPRVMGVFNQNHLGGVEYEDPLGYWLGAALAITSEHGRAWGINYAPVLGKTALRHPLSPISSQLISLDENGVSTVVSDEGLHEIIGDEFKTGGNSDPQRFWTTGRVTDHVIRVLTTHGHEFIGGTRSGDKTAIHLTRALEPIVDAGEIVSGAVIFDRQEADNKYFFCDLELLYATNIISFRLRFAIPTG